MLCTFFPVVAEIHDAETASSDLKESESRDVTGIVTQSTASPESGGLEREISGSQRPAVLLECQVIEPLALWLLERGRVQ